MEKTSNLTRTKRRSEMSSAERVQDLQRKLYLKAKQGKSQRGSRSFRQGAYVKLVSRYGLIDLTKIAIGLTPVHA